MKVGTDKEFSKTFSRRVDNRSEVLPTLWTEQATKPSGFAQAKGARVKDSVSDSGSIKAAVLDVINNAQEMLVLCSFLLADDDVEQALLNAEKRDVRVYCLIAAESRLDREEPEGEFDIKVVAQHKAMLKKLAGKVMFRTSSNFHAKVVLADFFCDSRARGVLLTANLTTDAMKRNEELLLELNKKEVAQLAEYLKWALWENAEHESIKSGSFSAVHPLGQLAHPEESLPVIATTHQCQQISKKAFAMIRSAKSEILVSCFGWDLEHKVVQALIDKAGSGISVTVFARIRPASMPALEALSSAGARVLGFKWLHAKALLVDRKQAMVMSANFQKHGLDEGFELGVLLKDERMQSLSETLDFWAKISRWQLKVRATVGNVLGKVQVWDGRAFKEAEVIPSKDMNLGQEAADSADRLTAPMPKLPPSGDWPYLAHELICQWVVVAPKLVRGAKELKDSSKTEVESEKKEQKKQKAKPVSYDPPVYLEPKGRKVVAIHSVGQLEPALKLQAELDLAAIVVE